MVCGQTRLDQSPGVWTAVRARSVCGEYWRVLRRACADISNRLERINAAPEDGAQRTRSKLRDAIPSVDELSSAVSRINTAPWEDPFALALGQAAPIAEEGEID